MNDHYALVIGIGHYKEYPTLRSPERDAARFCEWLTSKGGVPAENIQLVRANGDGTPVNKDIIAALQDLGVRMRRRRGKRLYFYYAGHGLGPSIKEVALIPADAATDACDDSFFGVEKCLDFFLKTGFFDEIVAFVDCCRDEFSVSTIGFPWKKERFEDACADGVNVFALMGSNHGSQSFELRVPPIDEVKYRGLMTDVLIDGLNGAPGAIDPGRKEVTSESLMAYVRRRVEEEAKNRGLPQRIDPWAHGGPDLALLSMQGAEVPTIELNIVVGPRSAGAAMVLQNLRTMAITPVPGGAAGSRLPPLEVAGDTRHQLMVPALNETHMIDPSKVRDSYDLVLP